MNYNPAIQNLPSVSRGRRSSSLPKREWGLQSKTASMGKAVQKGTRFGELLDAPIYWRSNDCANRRVSYQVPRAGAEDFGNATLF